MELKELDENCCKVGTEVRRESLSPDEVKLLSYIINKLLSNGCIPRVEELSSKLEISLSEVLRQMESLKNKSYIYIDPDSKSIRAVYPLSAVPTKHRVIVGKHNVFANCAIDALGIPLMLNRSARILSVCAECGSKIEIEVKKCGKVLNFTPLSTVVFFTEFDFNQPAVLMCCPYINFFCSLEHASEWIKGNPDHNNGRIINIEEATCLAQKIFDNLLTKIV